MPRDYRARENGIRAKARRANALARIDLRHETSPRQAAIGPTSHAVKVPDPDSARAIAEFMARHPGDK